MPELRKGAPSALLPTRAHGLGRLPSRPDPRNFRLVRYLPEPRAARVWLPVPRPPKVWRLPVLLNQGTTPRCIGFGTTHYIDAEPLAHTFGANYADELYAECKKIDGYPDMEGSTVHAAAKVLRSRGLIQAYAWAKHLGEVREWLLTQGPMVAGINWYRGMNQPDARGYIKPTGPQEDGHCFAITGWIPRSRLSILWDDVLCPNTWGPEWNCPTLPLDGHRQSFPGYFLLKAWDLGRLMAAQGEVLAAVEVPARGDTV